MPVNTTVPLSGVVINPNPNYLVLVHVRVTGTTALGSTRGFSTFAINSTTAAQALLDTATWLAANAAMLVGGGAPFVEAIMAYPYNGGVPIQSSIGPLAWQTLIVEAANPAAAEAAALAARAADVPAGGSIFVANVSLSA